MSNQLLLDPALEALGDAGLVRLTAHGTRNVYDHAPEGPLEFQRWLST